ncbi:hypothetical protein J6590_021329 [Homalodisca vitripennis]|nr:hypothetical protein J6590_021329 [Homalodisca vitripennis]
MASEIILYDKTPTNKAVDFEGEVTDNKDTSIDPGHSQNGLRTKTVRSSETARLLPLIKERSEPLERMIKLSVFDTDLFDHFILGGFFTSFTFTTAFFYQRILEK